MTAALFKQLMGLRQKRRAARDEKPHMLGQRPVEARIIKQSGVKGRHAHHAGCLWHQSEDRLEVKFWKKEDFAARQ